MIDEETIGQLSGLLRCGYIDDGSLEIKYAGDIASVKPNTPDFPAHLEFSVATAPKQRSPKRQIKSAARSWRTE